MGFRDFFKKNKNNNALGLDKVHQIINILWGQDGVKQVVSECKEAINFLLSEEGVTRKTDLLSYGLELSSELLAKANKNTQTSLGANCTTAFIYYRHFLECVLAIDNDIIHVLEYYTIFQVTKHIPAEMHPYMQTMIKTYDLLDRGIIYMYENMDNISTDYFSKVSAKIKTMLDAYEDDNTDWNKITR